MGNWRRLSGGGSTPAALGQPLEVNRTDLVPVKTVLKRMLQRIKPELPGAPLVGVVQKRTMGSALRHGTADKPAMLNIDQPSA